MSNNEVFQQVGQPVQPPSQNRDDIPVEVVTLPSKGALYQVGHPLCNEEAVEIRCMQARDEDLLSSRALIKNGTVLSKLLQSCILNKSIDPDDLLVGDRNALLVAIRVTGYGQEYKAKVTCPSCGEEYEASFNLGALKIKPLSQNPLYPNMNLFSFYLPLSGKEVQFRLLTGKDEDEISTITDKKKKLGSQVDNTITLRLLQSVVSIGGESDRGKLATIVGNLRAGDARALRKYVLDISPSVDMKQESKCTQCQEESEVEVPIGLSFFWPDISI